MQFVLSQMQIQDFSQLTLGGVALALVWLFLWKGLPWCGKQIEDYKLTRQKEIATLVGHLDSLTNTFKSEIAAERSTGVQQLMDERVAREKSEERMTAAIDRNTKAIQENTAATQALKTAVEKKPHSMD